MVSDLLCTKLAHCLTVIPIYTYFHIFMFYTLLLHLFYVMVPHICHYLALGLIQVRHPFISYPDFVFLKQ